MPFKSEAQRRKFHEMAKKGDISQKTLNEFEDSSKGLNLPEKVTHKPKAKKHKNKSWTAKVIK